MSLFLTGNQMMGIALPSEVTKPRYMIDAGYFVCRSESPERLINLRKLQIPIILAVLHGVHCPCLLVTEDHNPTGLGLLEGIQKILALIKGRRGSLFDFFQIQFHFLPDLSLWPTSPTS
uniref:Uncharacterized protein n=1 Tax=Lepeophtheirus salmonis TaxID=72036 RepID=A0A0K2V8C8_LEPSM